MEAWRWKQAFPEKPSLPEFQAENGKDELRHGDVVEMMKRGR
jgi:hypothetical protein